MAEAYARGKQKALAAGVKPPLCIVVQQVGRLDDYLRDVAQDMKLGLDESVITMAGLAVAKRTYQIFEQRGYDAVIMPAGLRGAYHLTEMAGGKLLYTINTRVQDMILAADPPQEERISNPVPQDILDQQLGAGSRIAVYTVIGAHKAEYAGFGQALKGGQIGLIEVLLGHDGVKFMAHGLRTGVDGIVLGAGRSLIVAVFVFFLYGIDKLEAELGGEIRIFAVGFLAAAPTGITENVDVRGPESKTLINVTVLVF